MVMYLGYSSVGCDMCTLDRILDVGMITLSHRLLYPIAMSILPIPCIHTHMDAV